MTDPMLTTTETAAAQLEQQLTDVQRQELEDATERLQFLQAATTQRDWLLITQKLNRTRAEVLEDGGLRMLALAFVKEKRDHGGASWDVLLDMTDDQLLELHGFPAWARGVEEPAQEPAPAEHHAEHAEHVDHAGDDGNPHRA